MAGPITDNRWTIISTVSGIVGVIVAAVAVVVSHNDAVVIGGDTGGKNSASATAFVSPTPTPTPSPVPSSEAPPLTFSAAEQALLEDLNRSAGGYELGGCLPVRTVVYPAVRFDAFVQCRAVDPVLGYKVRFGRLSSQQSHDALKATLAQEAPAEGHCGQVPVAFNRWMSSNGEVKGSIICLVESDGTSSRIPLNKYVWFSPRTLLVGEIWALDLNTVESWWDAHSAVIG